MNLNLDWLLFSKINNILDVKEQVNKTITNLKKVDVKYKSTKGDLSEQYDLFDSFLYDKNFLFILDKIKPFVINSVTEKKFIENIKDLKLINAWTVLGYKNSWHEIHNHCEYGYQENPLKKLKKNQISVVLYINVDKKSVKENNKGSFYFIINNNNDLEYYTIKPETGKIIVFPVWLFHGTYPQGNGLRQTLNLDFEVIK